jgi:hypothetical protein
MFGLFGNNKIECPVEESKRLYIDKCFRWLVWSFGKETIKSRRILTPEQSDFPIVFDGDEAAAWEVLDIIAPQMDLEVDAIELDFYIQPNLELKTGSAFENRVFLKLAEGEKFSAGHYKGKNEQGQFQIGLEYSALKQPEQMIATLAHELAHIKLLGEERIKKNNESLTDLTTVIFGLGIFNANGAFQFRNKRDSWGYTKLGYLTQMDWGYALALFAFIREEKTPDWIKYLSPNVKADFKQSEQFIYANKHLIMKPQEKPETEN